MKKHSKKVIGVTIGLIVLVGVLLFLYFGGGIKPLAVSDLEESSDELVYTVWGSPYRGTSYFRTLYPSEEIYVSDNSEVKLINNDIVLETYIISTLDTVESSLRVWLIYNLISYTENLPYNFQKYPDNPSFYKYLYTGYSYYLFQEESLPPQDRIYFLSDSNELDNRAKVKYGYFDRVLLKDLVTGNFNKLRLFLENCDGLGASDPYPYNGIDELRCNAYCKPNRGVCVDLQDGTWESQHCTSDGSNIVRDLCPGECIEGSCVGGIQVPQFFIKASLSGSYIFGKDAKFNVDLNVLGSNLVNGKLIQDGQVVSEVNQYTTSTGILELTFQNIQVLGLANVKISATVEGIYKEKMLQVNFQDLPILLTAQTQNYQYGDDLLISVNLKVDNQNYANNLVTGRIIKDGQTIKEATSYTNSQGNVQFSFLDVRVEGSAKLELSTVVNTRQKIYTKSIYFSPIPITIELPSLVDDYIYGSDLSIPIVIKYKSVGYPSTTVYGKIIQNGQVISEIVGFTNSEGKADLNFKTINALGFVNLEVKTNIKGVDKTATTSMYFVDIPPIILSIGSLEDTYIFGGDISVPLIVKLGIQPYKGAIINVKILSQGSPIKEKTITTNENGEAMITFENIDLIGDAQLVVSTTIRGKYKEASSNLFFEGIPIILSPSSKSLIQYNLENIVYQVNIENTFGSAITPGQIENLQASATLTDGSVLSSQIEYIGSGAYQVTSEVEGVGIYNGIIIFNYQDTPFTSIGINIEVKEVILAIDTSQIEPSIELNKNATYIITISSSLGSLVDPDNIIIEVTYPSGFETDRISMSQITKISEGVYEFKYNNFNEVEKYSFDIIVDKAKYTRGSVKASVSVTGAGGIAGPVWIGYIIKFKWLIVGVVIILIGLGIWFRVRKRR